MSTVPETMVCNYLGMKVLAVSCITNMATGIQTVKHSHARVLEIANQAGGDSVPLAECGDPEGGMNESALEIKKMHERLSKNYLSVNFSTLHLTLLTNGAITMACSGGRAKERAAR